LYDVEAVARLDLVRTLRDLGLPLESIRALLNPQTSLSEVAAVTVDAVVGDLLWPAGGGLEVIHGREVLGRHLRVLVGKGRRNAARAMAGSPRSLKATKPRFTTALGHTDRDPGGGACELEVVRFRRPSDSA
jgi:DNA-binding transcriptional MerR regulator